MKQNKKDILATLLFIVVVIGCVLAAVFLFENDNNPESVAWQGEIQQSIKSMYEPKKTEVFPAEEVSEEEWENAPEEEPESESELMRVYPTGEWAVRHENHLPEDFAGPNYGELVNCIDTDVSYKVNHFYYSHTERVDRNVCASVVQLEGDIPNLKHINEVLMDSALARTKWEVRTWEFLNENEISVLETDSYVTGNCERFISVVIRTRWTGGAKDNPNISDMLRAYNIDLEQGIILINDEIVDMTGFGPEFKRQSEEIYGQRPEFSWMREKEYESMICNGPLVFFTPLGMELGFNSANGETWMTITMEEYEEFLRNGGVIFKR